MARFTPTPISPDTGDTLAACDLCSHALAGYDAAEAYVVRYPLATLEGVEALRAAQTAGDVPFEYVEAGYSDSTLWGGCGVCGTPRERFQGYSVIRAQRVPVPVVSVGDTVSMGTYVGALTGTVTGFDTGRDGEDLAYVKWNAGRVCLYTLEQVQIWSVLYTVTPRPYDGKHIARDAVTVDAL